MSLVHEAVVRSRFDLLEARFKTEVPADDARLRSVLSAFLPLEGRRVLDLGCGKGRFASHLVARGARVVGLDLSTEMLARAGGFDRLRGSARRLPFEDGAFDRVLAVEVLEHVSPRSLDAVLMEMRRVLRPGGVAAIVDKNAWSLNARRPWLPSVLVKRIDERRGLWMYEPGSPVRERWFSPRGLKKRLERGFTDVRVEHLLSPGEAGRWPFESWPASRLMALWSARVPGGARG
jgi:SAM-dependent methyltransferase